MPLATIAREWTRIGVTGFGGPPAHITLLRQLVVARNGWMDGRSFEDAIAACNLLPGPASTQLAIFCAYRVGGWPGAIVGGLGFVVPAVVMVLALATVFLAQAPPTWIRGAGAGAGAAVAAVALRAGLDLVGPSFARVREDGREELRWAVYLLVGAVAGALTGAFLVLVLLACGLLELALRRRQRATLSLDGASLALVLAVVATSGGIGALCWTAFKVGALSFGGGFVIVPLMQGDAVHTYHWMTNAEFLNADALLAAAVAFVPSFSFILLGGGRFERLRANANARAFLEGAGPAAIGAILGAAIPLTGALSETWQFFVLAAAALGLLALRRGIVLTLLGAGAVGVVIALAGGPVPS